MSTLKIKQTTSDGRVKTWKVDSKRTLLTLGNSRKSTFGSIDRSSSAYDAAIEYRPDGWHFITFDVKNPTPDLIIKDNMTFKFSESELHFSVIEQTDYVLNSLQNIKENNGQIKKKIMVVSKNNRILKTEVKNLNQKFFYSIGGVNHTLPFKGLPDWENHEIEGFHFKSKIVGVSEVSSLAKPDTDSLMDKESKKLLIATLSAMFLFIGIGLFSPSKDNLDATLVIPKSSSPLVMKMEKKKPAEIAKKPEESKKAEGPIAEVKNPTPTEKPAAGAGPASKDKGKVNAMIKGAIGVRISKLIGKVSATEARTSQVLVTANGIKAGEGDSGRALAAVGKVESSGRNWTGEAAASGGSGGVSTAGFGGGKDATGLGGGLKAGKTGSGGVGLIEDESEITGGLDREVIAQYIKSQLGQILYCYERQLSANPELYGKVAVKFTISGNGSVESQAINQSTLKSIPVEGCILSKVAKWKFPEPKGGTKVVVTYPFLFKSTN